jgi:FecR protein
MAIQFCAGWLLAIGCCFVGSSRPVCAAVLADPRLTKLVRNVRVAESGAVLQPASLDRILNDPALVTGPESRAEITFRDQGVVRLGDNTTLAIHSKDRTIELTSGAILLQMPKRISGTCVKVGAVTATASGTALAVEHFPDAYIKFIAIDGTSRLCLKTPGRMSDCVLLRAGQMLIVGPTAKGLPEVVDVNLSRFLETCQLITEFSQLPGQDRLIKSAVDQRKHKLQGSLVDTNLVIFGRGTLVSLTDPNAGATAQRSPAPSSSESPANKKTIPSP